ncbi:Cys-tRNA(Pro) deacylase [Sinanaerobacter sp. ZZT-01]|uniref:Cys-tRNA(Pro) deacylase n=1 Tax=Sinanaerobacter sp. ZZT-01 TaxID=3111540 RepID=UPI002D766C43|nr:Cys-tRNA(Pro) deacylase [Sinanaerobacter sp. ZZT-01]WRR94809.1 Cys-tRNA(Pro) deacylase [Sinanaerobacter sp. ZZT-01]
MSKASISKTNALRLLDAKKIAHQIYTYNASNGFSDGLSVAKSIGKDPNQVFKTLVTQGSSKEYYVCVIPVSCELDLKKAAKHFKEKKVEMIPAKNITNITGYIKGGCSPIGMKKQFPTCIDQKAAAFDTIIVSGGRIGLQMELSVHSLCELTEAQLTDLTVE